MRLNGNRRAAHVLLALGLLMLTACANAQPRWVIVAWHTLSGARERAFLRLVDRWNQANGEGVIIMPERRDPGAQHRALLEGATSGLLPDLALVQPAEAAIYAQRGLLAPLDRFTDSDDATMNWDTADRADLFPFAQQAGRAPQGQLLGAPFGGKMQVMLTNRDWMNSLGQAEIPADWETFGKVCDGAADRTAGTACFGFDPNDPSAEDWLYAHGAPIYDLATQQVQITSASAVSAIERCSIICSPDGHTARSRWSEAVTNSPRRACCSRSLRPIICATLRRRCANAATSAWTSEHCLRQRIHPALRSARRCGWS